MQSTSKAAVNDCDETKSLAKERVESKELSLEEQIARDIEPAYKFVKLCGRGSQGLVFKAIHTKTNTQVAIKKVDNIFRHPGMARRYLRELQIMVQTRTLSHVVHLKDIIVPRNDLKTFDSLYLVMCNMRFDLSYFLANQPSIDRHMLKYITF